MLCSRFDLFQTGVMSMPSFLAYEGGELGMGSVGEAIADAEGVFRADFHRGRLVDFDDGFDRAERGVGEFLELGRDVLERDAVGDPEASVDFTVADQLDDVTEICG